MIRRPFRWIFHRKHAAIDSVMVEELEIETLDRCRCGALSVGGHTGRPVWVRL